MGSPGSALHTWREVELHGKIFGYLKVGEVSHTTSTTVNALSYFQQDTMHSWLLNWSHQLASLLSQKSRCIWVLFHFQKCYPFPETDNHLEQRTACTPPTFLDST